MRAWIGMLGAVLLLAACDNELPVQRCVVTSNCNDRGWGWSEDRVVTICGDDTEARAWLANCEEEAEAATLCGGGPPRTTVSCGCRETEDTCNPLSAGQRTEVSRRDDRPY